MDNSAILQDNTNPLPTSSIYELRSTATSGRAVFATTTIPKDKLILSTSTVTRDSVPSQWLDTSPLAWLIQRPYRKECCAECFAYDRGREWKLKVPDRDCGIAFCSQPCLDAWSARNGDVGIQAWANLEAGVKSRLKRKTLNDDERDVETHNVSNGHNEDIATNTINVQTTQASSTTAFSEAEISSAWDTAQLLSEAIQRARNNSHPSKTERKVLRTIAEQGGDPDLMYYLLTAVIQAYNAAAQNQHQHNRTSLSTSTPIPSSTPSLLSPLFHLSSTLTAYNSSHTSLPLYTASHLYLHTILPQTLAPYLSTSLSHNLNTRAAHNAFSIRPPSALDGPDSGEFLGWAVYPSASFFNHSCSPNIKKIRKGRAWEFFADREVREGEELCITYLGGEEQVLSVDERRSRLRGEWGFVCRCVRCRRESCGDDTGEQGQ